MSPYSTTSARRKHIAGRTPDSRSNALVTQVYHSYCLGKRTLEEALEAARQETAADPTLTYRQGNGIEEARRVTVKSMEAAGELVEGALPIT